MPSQLRIYLENVREDRATFADVEEEDEPQNEMENKELQSLRNEAAKMLTNEEDATDVINSLLAEQGDVDMWTTTCRRPLLSIAAAKAPLQVLDLLLGHKACVNASGHDGRTPLHYAADRGDLAILRRLLCNKADPHHISDNGFTPAYSARLFARDDCIQNVCRVLKEFGHVDDDEERKQWRKRYLKDSNEDWGDKGMGANPLTIIKTKVYLSFCFVSLEGCLAPRPRRY
jgi:ankyrin repeat protein